MANEHSRSSAQTRRASVATRLDDLANWRRLTRPVIVENFLNHTRDLRWSRELIDLLLDELHVSDEFDDLIGRVPPSAQVNYPQLVALAVVLRHSWYPEDLARIIAETTVEPSANSPAVGGSPSSEVIDSANRRSFANQATASPHTCTAQKGERRTC
jgi:hypothetical protein